LQQCSDFSGTYDLVAGALLNDYQLDRLLALVQACRAQFPENHNHEYYEGMVYLNRGEPAQAEPLFRAGLKICPADEREYFLEQLIAALLRQDKFEQAYQEADDPRQAFQQMLDQYRYNQQKLEQVLALHRAKHPADPWLPYAEGLILVSRNQLDQAVGKFQPLLNSDDDQLAAVVSENYLSVMIRLGRYVEALESVPNKEDAFHELVRSLNVRIKANELEALANAYALHQPGDPWVAIYRARAQYFRGNFPAAANQLQDQFDRVHPDDKSVVESYYIQARVAEGNPQRAYRDASDKRAAFQQLAREYDCPLHHPRLRDLITIHQAVDPRDLNIPYYQGRLLVDSDPAQAAQSYLQAWQQVDRDAYSPAQWEYPRMMVKLGQEQEALRQAPERPAAFYSMAWQLRTEKQFDRLAALCAAYAEMVGDEPTAALLQFQGLVARQQGDSARAVELLNQAVAVVQDQASAEYYDDEELEEIYEPLAELVVERGEALQAYEASSDRATLGYWLLEELQEQQQWDVAIELAKRYAQEFPADTWNFALLVDSYLGAKQFDEAEQWCRQQVTDNPGEDSEQLLRDSLVKIRYRQGQFREAYQSLRPARDVLSQLVNLCVQDSDAATLEELVALHREQDPDDPGLLRAEIELAKLKKDFSKLADLLLEQDARRKTGGGYYYLDEELLRALARSGRSQQALQLASVAPGAVLLGEREYYQQGMIYALAADHEQALEAFQRCLERIPSDHYRIQSIYNGQELGPIVREHAAYAPLREKYPPPPKDE
jgi:tetratricopeptide (TPR) repeat protein